MQARFRIALAQTAAIAGLGLFHSPFATAGQTASVDHSVADAVPLSDDDLRFITDHVLTQNPLMSSSPGIKFAAATRSGVYDLASVIYYPHIDSAGFKEAFQVQCRRQVPKEPWVCGDAEIRRYLQMDSQDFEVRVTGGISSDAALALISATRDALQANAEDDANIPQTAIMNLGLR